jgi:hypothetical protein
MIALSFNEAMANIKTLVKADPFTNEVYRRLSFWAKLFVTAQDNGKDTAIIHGKAMKHIIDNNLQNSDATGTIDAIIDRLYEV